MSTLGDDRAARWYVVQTKPTKERLALRNLQQQRFETFCPLVRRVRRRGKCVSSEAAPFFSSYIFVYLDLGRDAWRSINGTLGVARIVMAGDCPVPAPIGLVENFILNTSEDGVLDFEEDLRRGDQVRIVGGHFDNMCGKLLSSGRSQRVWILLEMLLGQTSVRVERKDIMAA